MPLRGKIVVIKRSGVDGTEFPLTATCLFGRKDDCDIRIQLPQVSKEHCRIDLNENKEVILTNLSAVNPTRINGEVLQQSERLKHGDVITVIDRSFRFEYPPAPTPKRSSRGAKPVLQEQEVREKGEKRVSEVSTDPLKDGSNHGNIQQSLEKTVLLDSHGGDGPKQSKSSPFSDLYQMIKQSLDVKTPRKSSVGLIQTPSSKFCTPKPGSVRKSEVKPAVFSEGCGTQKKDEVKVGGSETSAKKKRRSSQVVLPGPDGPGAEREAASVPPRSSATPEKLSVSEVIEKITQTPKSPVRRRSKEATPAKEQAEPLPAASPKSSKKVKDGPNKRKSGEVGADLPALELKRKRVSFGGQLSPELFDKRLPPDSPLRRGATPRRSLSLLRPKQSLIRRASVIGVLKEFESPVKTKKSSASPKTPTPEKKAQRSKSSSPKAATPAKRSPKSASSSPKAATPAKISPKAATPAPKSATPVKISPKSATKSPKSATPAKKSPKSASSSPKSATPATKSPKSATPKSLSSTMKTPTTTPGVSTPSVQGRFSVSQISTPSPVSEGDGLAKKTPSVAATPVLRLKRTSMKSTSKKTPSLSKSAVKLLQRRSGVSRASLKASNCWADIVKFGKPKPQGVAQSRAKISQKTAKKPAPKPRQKTPAKSLKGHVSTGHADSPATIVVGRAHKRAVTEPSGAAPRVLANIAVLKKNMKMDEDLSGISEMFKTPVNKKRSVGGENGDVETAAGGQTASVVDPSVLNTPEEPGEMMVSPLSAASVIKGRKYNDEAVQRLFSGGEEESGFVGDVPALEIESEAADLKPAAAVATPKQKPEQQECLTGVKRMMKTPRQKAEPLEDLRGKILKTPKQKPEQEECLTGVKRMMKTPKQKAEPVEDLRGKILKTPKQKAEQEECLSGVKRIFKTPQQEVEPLQILKTPQAPEAADVDAEEILETPQVCQDLSAAMETPAAKMAPQEHLTGVKRLMKSPKEKSAPVEDLVGLKRIMKTPKVKGQPVEENFGIKRLMKSPRPRGNAPVEDFEGLKELMEEPPPEAEQQPETKEDGDQKPAERGADAVGELEFAPQNPESPDVTEVSKLDGAEAVEDVDMEPPACEENVPEAAADENLLIKQAPDETVDESLQTRVETAAAASAEEEAPVPDPAPEKKPVRGKRAKTVESKAAEEEEEAPKPQSPVAPAPARGRRAKKPEVSAPPAARQTRRRNAKSEDVEETAEPTEVAVKPKRGRNARKVSERPAELVPEAEVEEQREQKPAAEVEQPAEDEAVPAEKLAAKPKRGRNAKQPRPAEPEQPDAGPTEEAEPNTDDGNELEASQSESDSTQKAEADEAAAEAETSAAAVQKKSARGKQPESNNADEKPEPVRGRRGRKAEAAAPPAARQTKRGRKAKAPGSVAEQPVEETQPESITPESQSQEESVSSAEPVAAVVPQRGRRAKATPAASAPPEPEVIDAASDEQTEAEPELSVPPPAKPRRGRKTKADAAEEKAEDVAVAVETSQQPPVRAKRGRSAKVEEEGMGGGAEATESKEPVNKVRRTRKTEQKAAEPEEEVPPVETVVSQEAVGEPAAAAKPRRGQKSRKEADSEPAAAAAEEKPKRGRRGKQAAAEETEASSENQDKMAPEETGSGEAEAAPAKPGKARGAKTPANSQAPQVAPAKRARRGAAPPPEEPSEEPAAEQADPAESKTSKRSVKWKLDVEVFEISKCTPARAGRGKRLKAGDKVEAESKTEPKEAEKTEEEDLSGKSARAPPLKRARRGAKAEEEATESPPKPRRGRAARK